MRRSAVFAAAVTMACACGRQVKSVTVQPESITLRSDGAVAKLWVSVRDEEDKLINDAEVAWTSSTPKVATVDNKGAVTAHASGSATIAAAVGKVRGTRTVIVTIPASIDIEPKTAEAVGAGQEIVLAAKVKDDTGGEILAPPLAWDSDNERVAKVIEGRVTTQGIGSATIKASLGRVTGQAAVIVTAPKVARLAVKPATLTVKKGKTAALQTASYDAKGNLLPGMAVSWSSSNEGVATVSGAGAVAGVKKGTAVITAQSGDAKATVKVTVKK